MFDVFFQRTINPEPTVSVHVYISGDATGCIVRGAVSHPVQDPMIKSCEMDRWLDNLDRMCQLKEGWNGYSAPVPSRTAIVTARDFLEALSETSLEPSRVAPSVEGGVGITHKKAGRRVYVEFFNNGAICALFSDNSSAPKSERVAPYRDRFRELAARIREYLDA
jgi:hypothetical protein